MVNGIAKGSHAKGKRLSCLLLGLWLQEPLYQVACHSYNSLFLLPQRPGVPGVVACGSSARVYVKFYVRQQLSITSAIGLTKAVERFVKFYVKATQYYICPNLYGDSI
ncbi:MAG: hypothetical protein Fur006_25710 [Coleofasciculaceae cyanobacterium]